MKKNANQALSSFLSMRKDFHQDNGHSSDLDQKRSGILLTKTNTQGENGTELRRANDDNICRKLTPSLPIHKSIIQRSAQEQRVVENCQYTSVPMKPVFHTIISVKQLSIYGAVSDLCEECKTCHVRTGRLVVAGQSNPLCQV